MAKRWYVIHTYSGYENKVKANLEHRIESMSMADKIFNVFIPKETVTEIKQGGKKVTSDKKVFPGYILVRDAARRRLAGTSCATRRASPVSWAARASRSRSPATR